MLVMVANDNAGYLISSVVIAFFASVLAPTVKVGVSVTVGAVIDLEVEAGHTFHTRFKPPIRQQP